MTVVTKTVFLFSKIKKNKKNRKSTFDFYYFYFENMTIIEKFSKNTKIMFFLFLKIVLKLETVFYNKN